MKNKLLIIFLLASILSYGQSSTDTSAKPTSSVPPKTVVPTVKKDSTKKDTVKVEVPKTTVAPNPVVVQDKSCPCIGKETALSGGSWVLVFMPILLFIILLIILLKGALRDFKFIDALSENEQPRLTILNPEYSSPTTSIQKVLAIVPQPTDLSDIVPPTLEVSVLPGGTATTTYRPSISRFIALFSGMLTVIVAVCMVSFFLYNYMHTGCPPDLSNLSTVLIALGVGVAPYAINKVSSALASRKADD